MDNIRIRIPLTVSQRQQTIPLGVQAGGGGTRNYNALTNKPAINGHELVGDQTAAELGLATPQDIPTAPTKTSDLTNDSGFVDAAGAAAAAPVQSVNGQTGEVTLDAEDVGALPEGTTLDDIPDGSTYKRPTAAQVQQISTNTADIQTQGGEIDQLQTDVDAIEGKIPNQASPSNQLADKAFVNSSINSAAAYFRGAFPTRAALFAVPWQTSNPGAENYVSNNDYAYVADDETHNDEAWRYIYVLQPGGADNGWQAQFRVNESPLTAAQLAALNSGATAALIEQISINAAAIALKQAIINASGILKGNGNGQISAAVAGTDYATPAQVNAKYTKPAGGIPKTDLTQEVQTSLGKADTALQAVPDTYRTAAAQDVIDNNKAPVILDTASGHIASFPDGMASPLKKLTVNIMPVQRQPGTPSPNTPRPVTGWTECNIFRIGHNPCSKASILPNTAINTTSGNTVSSSVSDVIDAIPVEGGKAYLFTFHFTVLQNEVRRRSVWFDDQNNPVGSATYYPIDRTIQLAAPANAKKLSITVDKLTDGFVLYAQADTGTIAFPSAAGTVYSGTLTINEDGSGELKARPEYESYNGETLVGPWISSMDVYAPGTTPTIGAQVVDLGGEESVYPITAQQITTLFGTNNIWADCGDVEVTYRADTKLFVEKNDAGLSSQINAKLDAPATAGATGQILEKGATGTVWADRDKVVTVTGTTPTITALPGVRYVCGEVPTLDITLPASGIVDVTFKSGSTATVLTVTPPTGVTVKWANGFDPTALEANTTYEINIADGLGVAASWT